MITTRSLRLGLRLSIQEYVQARTNENISRTAIEKEIARFVEEAYGARAAPPTVTPAQYITTITDQVDDLLAALKAKKGIFVLTGDVSQFIVLLRRVVDHRFLHIVTGTSAAPAALWFGKIWVIGEPNPAVPGAVTIALKSRTEITPPPILYETFDT